MNEQVIVKVPDHPPGSSIVTTDPGFSWTDAGIVLAIVVAALGYLYHKLWRKRGACAECGSKEGSCATPGYADCNGETRVPADRISKAPPPANG